MGYSGLSYDRPGLETIFSLAKAGEIDVLVTTECSRLSRNISKTHQLIKQLDELGVIVEFSVNPTLTTEAGLDDSNELISEITKAMRQQESKALSKRIKAGIKRKKLEAKNN
jgi:DNA invertase Pin-like site-specific DNA recombinase